MINPLRLHKNFHLFQIINLLNEYDLILVCHVNPTTMDEWLKIKGICSKEKILLKKIKNKVIGKHLQHYTNNTDLTNLKQFFCGTSLLLSTNNESYSKIYTSLKKLSTIKPLGMFYKKQFRSLKDFQTLATFKEKKNVYESVFVQLNTPLSTVELTLNSPIFLLIHYLEKIKIS